MVSGAWSLERTEYYGYDSSLDYLTSVDYNDGLSNEYRTWDYDAAGNRTSDSALTTGSWAYDNLNRMTSSPKLFGSGSTSWAYTNDILGNRTWRNNVYSGTGATRYDWDILNRMLLCANATSGSTYSYRADGQRIEKVDGVTLSWTGNRESGHYDTNYATSRPTYRYFYDGQMGIEDDYNPSGTVTKVNRYGLGARGIDRIEAWDGTNTTYGYPLYDGHGNMRGTLGRSGSSYSTGNWRTYDVWGGVRSGNGTGDPKQRYCANLGHVQDDESGLIYMRARYHDPLTGRFLSEDPVFQGWNWMSYCANDPINNVDESGRDYEKAQYWYAIGLAGAALAVFCMLPPLSEADVGRIATAMFFSVLSVAAFTTSFCANESVTRHYGTWGAEWAGFLLAAFGGAIASFLLLIKASTWTSSVVAVAACFVYMLIALGALQQEEISGYALDK